MGIYLESLLLTTRLQVHQEDLLGHAVDMWVKLFSL
jgi:hypothetical protein